MPLCISGMAAKAISGEKNNGYRVLRNVPAVFCKHESVSGYQTECVAAAVKLPIWELRL